MSRKPTAEQITNLILSLPYKPGRALNIHWQAKPVIVARIVKALLSSNRGTTQQVSNRTLVHVQTLNAICRGKTPSGDREWPELREALSKMKCEWRGKTSVALLPVTSESLTEVFSAPEVIETKTKPVKKRKSKVTESVSNQLEVKGKETSKTESHFDLESKELVVITTTRYTLKDWQKVITFAASSDFADFCHKHKMAFNA